jgi:hypothetical protein
MFSLPLHFMFSLPLHCIFFSATAIVKKVRNGMGHLRCDFVAPRSAFFIIDLFNFSIDIIDLLN